MPNVAVQEAMQTIEILREEFIEAPIDVVFETVLEQMGPLNEKPDGEPLALKLEAWPGGRWFRDLGNNSGHFWSCTGDQTTRATRDLWAIVYVHAGRFECAVPPEERGFGDTFEVLPSCCGLATRGRS